MAQPKLKSTEHDAVAIVAVGAIMPDAADAKAFWSNIKEGRYSIRDVPADYWDPALYYDADPAVPDKAYSKIGGFSTDWSWEPFKWKLPIPPKVSDVMDRGQKWAIMCAREALIDFGYPERPLDRERTAVIIGNALSGDQHYRTALRILTPEIIQQVKRSPAFAALPAEAREQIIDQAYRGVGELLPPISEDTMPGELGNIIAGRVAALFDLHGPNFTTDAACASAMAAFSAAVEGLLEHRYDAVLTGGVDANMTPVGFVKFCKIGALSPTGSRPFDANADGFVMGEGAALFLLKRLADAERDGDRIYAVMRGMGGASDGKGKGITAPNPVGQKLAVARGWANAGCQPDTATMIECHGTSTRVGDRVEAESLRDVLADLGLPARAIPIGSVKSNIGHLKAAAGAAGIFKATLALRDKQLPPSLNFNEPNPHIDFERAPFYVNTALRPWEVDAGKVRRVGVSAFGFGGTNFHAVLEEHIPGRLTSTAKSVSVPVAGGAPGGGSVGASAAPKTPLRGALVLGVSSKAELIAALKQVLAQAEKGVVPQPEPPQAEALSAPFRLAIDFGGAAELVKKAQGALRALESGQVAMWKALKAQGVFYGEGEAPKVAFLYTGQGSQYVNMARQLREQEPLVAEMFERADEVMEPLLGKKLTDYIFVDANDRAAVLQAERDLMQTAITQPAVLAVDQAMTNMMAAYGICPDMVMGHSLGEYGALVAANALPFAHALEAVSARGREMTRVSVEDNGLMAAVFGPMKEIERLIASVDGYVVVANINSQNQAVIGGSTPGVKAACELLEGAGFRVQLLPVSHAFHTRIVAPASEPLQEVLRRLDISPPAIPLVANTTGQFYPMHPGCEAEIVDILGEQIASPVQFVKGLETLYAAGCRVFVEMGPKKALAGFVDDVLGAKGDVVSLFANHPKLGDRVSFNHALCGLYAAGLGVGVERMVEQPAARPVTPAPIAPAPVAVAAPAPVPVAPAASAGSLPQGTIDELGRIFADFLERGMRVYSGEGAGAERATPASPAEPSVVISGAAVGLPGGQQVFSGDNVQRLLHGEQCIAAIPADLRQAMIDKNVTRLVKDPVTGSGKFVTLDDPSEAIKLAGRPGKVALSEEFGYPADRLAALDIVTKLGIGAGIKAMHDAGIPLVQHYKTTTKGTKLPDRWMLPESMCDDTGIIFASAFPGYEAYADEMRRYWEYRGLMQRLDELRALRASVANDAGAASQLDLRIAELEREAEANAYVFDRRFLFKILGMGHAQFAEYIGARGPNTLINAACASGTQGVGLAHDWIRSGRCRRVIVISCDSVTSDNLMEWIGAGFLASGAAATDEKVEDAALPFDRRRHGLLIGMGVAAVIVEEAESLAERGVRPVSELLETTYGNSAFHGSRLDVHHITGAVEELIARAEQRWGISRAEIARELLFVSHETFTPARGGSAQAEVSALRHVFGEAMNNVVVANTKGFTGHAMGTGIEDVLAVKALETGVVPPVPNYKEIDPELGTLNLSRGGSYPIRYALRLAAGFGSQMALTLQRWVPSPDGHRPQLHELGFTYRTDHARWSQWLADVTGYDAPELEVEKNTLRVKAQGPALRAPRPARPMALRPPVVSVAASAPQPATVPSPTAPAPSAKASVATTPPAQSAPPAVAAAVAAAPAGDAVADKVMAIIAEQTGYPPDMLDPELDLEADLGIDTVKQAETFAAVRDAYGIERDDKMQLRDFPTINAVVGFVRKNRPDLAQGAPAASAAAPIAVAPAAASAGDAVAEKVMAIIAEQTGYPPDMLDPELDLEADLGIDTVKQAETFAAVRDAYGIERDDKMQLRDFPTINAVVGFVRQHRPDLAQAVVAGPAAPSPAASAAPAGDGIAEKVMAIIAEQTGYPSDMLDPELDLEADLGIDTVKQAETFAAVREAYGIERDDKLQLRDFPTINAVVGFVRSHRPDLVQAAAPAPAASAAAAAPRSSARVEDEVLQRVMAIIADQTGYPADMLDPELDLEADLGIDTVKQAETFAAVREAYSIERDDKLQLRDFPTINAVVGFVRQNRPDLAAPVAAAPVATESATDAVLEQVMTIIADQTGYPADMLDPELDLEADLGIDTVKQAETFAAVRETFGIERDDKLQLRDFPTINHVVGFVYDRKPELRDQAPRAAGVQQTASPAAAAAQEALVEGKMEAAASIPRRLPTPILRPPLSLCKPTEVFLGKGKRVLVMADSQGIAKQLESALEKRGVEVLLVGDAPAAEELLVRIQGSVDAGAIDGVYWLPGLDGHAPISELSSESYQEALRVRVKLLYHTMRTLYEQIARKGSFLISATRLGGQHGYGDEPPFAPLGGAITGFTKAYKRERPEALVKAVDFAADADAAFVVSTLLAETEADPGLVEVGHIGDDRFTVGLMEQPLGDDTQGMTLDERSVFVVTGAAGSIVSAIVADLARASKGIFYLLDLTETPDPQDPDLLRFASDREGLKREIFERLKARGERATPKMVERELAALERKQSALAAIEAVRAAGGEAHYHSVNLLDTAAVRAVVDALRAAHGRVDVLLHAAGLEISRFLPDKEPAEFDLVFDVKTQGWHNLLAAIGEMPLGATVSFSSIAGRFGNGGQTDYSAANDLLCKTSNGLRATWPEIRAISLDWTAWGGIGMATRGSIPKMMELARIDMLPPEAGIAFVRRELTMAPRGCEVVVAQSLGVMLEEFDETGGLDAGAINDAASRPMAARVLGMGLYSGLTVETELDPQEQPFLYDHQIDGTPVLPGVMGIEAFGELAKVLFSEWHVVAVEDVRFLAPFKFYRNQRRKLILRATYQRVSKEELVADCQLIGERELKGQSAPQITQHFSARVRLGKKPLKKEKAKAPKLPKDGKSVDRDAIYEIYFHGPAYQVLEKSWRENGAVYGLMPAELPVDQKPDAKGQQMLPRLIELCFQTAGVWEIGRKGSLGLPRGIDRVSVLRDLASAKGRLFAVVTPDESGERFDAYVADEKGQVFVKIDGYHTISMPGGVDDEKRRPLQAVMG